ncbi:thioesterase [Bacillus stratosphericus]|uniref:thioesterase II family protein n=1 Tax=Bacillus altitudinis TaxID=293387 RepID=UPI00064F1FA9|nr:alpha/beta fold hydrolase [Bacillus altitudinis]KML03902.1 thioesterase [Bacillus stratosphericus]MBY0185888.1 thioesterase [Bacillus aerophilus]KML59058.1 thioesterase [Bacillus stratosphericus]MCY7580218.1 alpha/beta fold hydrolase [Bacillus altitudinis]MCY7596526.1 alpha/beta fold hydrolase [Bacillus altitudinis]
MNQLFKTFEKKSDLIQLICFPFAGGYSASYRPLFEKLKDTAEVTAAEPPGHGTNLMPLETSIDRLAELYKEGLTGKLNRPFILFGHSMGGLVVYRLTQLLEKEGIDPAAVVISAIQPPQTKRQILTHLSNEAFVQHIAEMGGIPKELLENKPMMDYFTPSLRADYQALESFQHTDKTIIESPVYLLNGKQDKKCMEDAAGWLTWANAIERTDFEGGHMYINTHLEQFAEHMRHVIEQTTKRQFISQ